MDAGHQVACEAIVTYPLTGVTASAASAPLLIAAAPPAARPAATLALLRRAAIRGVAKVGRVLVCVRPRMQGASALAFSWRRDGRVIRRARKSRYTVRRADRGRRLSCAVRASGGGRTLTTVSRAVRVRR